MNSVMVVWDKKFLGIARPLGIREVIAFQFK